MKYYPFRETNYLIRDRVTEGWSIIERPSSKKKKSSITITVRDQSHLTPHSLTQWVCRYDNNDIPTAYPAPFENCSTEKRKFYLRHECAIFGIAVMAIEHSCLNLSNAAFVSLQTTLHYLRESTLRDI